MSTGGSAMYYGANFQADIAALFAIAALAEDTSALPRDVVQPQTSQLPPVRIGAEQNWPTDDIAVWFRSPGRWWLQSKGGLQYSAGAESDFAAVFDQFVSQWKHGREREPGTALIRDDRLWLVLGDGASQPLRVDLRDLLDNIAMLGVDVQLSVATNGEPRLETALERLRSHVGRALAALDPPIEPTDANVGGVARHMRLWSTNQDTVQSTSRTLLGAHVVRDDTQVAAAYAVLQQTFADAGQHRQTRETSGLRALLRNQGIALKEPRSIVSDVERLKSYTRSTLGAERRRTAVRAAPANATPTSAPQAATSPLAQSVDLLKAGKTHEAIAILDAYIAAHPGDAAAFMLRGAAYDVQGDKAKALDDYNAALAIKPGIEQIQVAACVTSYELHRLDDTIAACTKALALDPNDTVALDQRALALDAKDDAAHEAQAIPDVDRSIQIKPSAWAYAERCELQIELARWASALPDCEQSLALDPSMGWTWVQRGRIALHAGDFATAKESFQKAIADNTTVKYASVDLAQAELGLGEYADALQAVNGYISANPNVSGALLTKAKIEAKLGNTADAREDAAAALAAAKAGTRSTDAQDATDAQAFLEGLP